MQKHASDEWFAKAEECLAEAAKLHESGFQEGACSRAFYAMVFAAKAGIKHGMIEGYVNVAMPNDPSETLKVFKERFATPRKLDPSLLRDFRTVLALKVRADITTATVLMSQAEEALNAANRFTFVVREATARRRFVEAPTIEEVAATLGGPRR